VLTRRNLRAVYWGLILLGLSGNAAGSQSARTIKIIVPFPPGGTATILARLLAEQISRVQEATILIENRPGAGASIGYEAIARAVPDGNTLGINGNSIVINPILRKVNYDPLTSFEPICYLVSSPQLIVVNSASPYRTRCRPECGWNLRCVISNYVKLSDYRFAFKQLPG